MPEHRKQILAAILALLILALAFHLRASGLGWSLPGHYHHPDERGIIMATEGIHFRPVPHESGEGWMPYLVRAAKANLTVDSPLNPKAFHYGSLPYYLMAGTSGVFEAWRLPVPEDGSGTALKRLPGHLLVFWACLMFILAIVHRWRYQSAPLPRWFLLWVGIGAAAWIGGIAFLHQTAILRKVFAPEGSSLLRFLPGVIGLLFSFLPALALIVQTWILQKIDPKASLSRLRICFLLLFAALAAWLFGKGLPGILQTRWNYPVLGYIGRSISVLAGVGTVALTYSYGSRCYNRLTRFLAALFLGLTVLHIQLCHYSAFDVHLAFFIMLALNLFERVQAHGRLWAYALSGAAMGAAIAVKFSAVTLPLLFLLPHLLFLLSLSWRGTKLWRIAVAAILSLSVVGLGLALRENHLLLAAGLLAGLWLTGRIVLHSSTQTTPRRYVDAWIGLALALLIGYCTLYIFQPFGFIDSAKYWSNINEQNNMVTGRSIPPYTIQYLKTAPFAYCIEQLLARGFGFPLGIVVLTGWGYALLKQFRRGDKATLLLLAWSVPSFYVYGRFQVKYPRYLVILAPALCLMGALLVNDLLQYGKKFKDQNAPAFLRLSPRWIRRATVLTLILILAATATYAFAFVQIYHRPHTWDIASRWIYANIPKGSRILCEHWDNDLPLGLPENNRERMGYRHDYMQVYERPDRPSKIDKMARQLAQANYVILPTKRGYGSILRDRVLFPLTTNYYRALFAGCLGYEPVKVVASPAKVFGVPLYDDLLDESLRVYDHPKVVIFKKTEELSSEQIEALIVSPPAWVQSLTYEEILSLRDGLPVYAKAPRYPLIRWYLCLQLIGFVFFPFCYPLTRTLRDGGWSLARSMGVLLLAYFAWMAASVKLIPFGGQGLWLILIIFLAISISLYRKYGAELKTLFLQRWRVWLFEEILWLAILGLFLSIRMNNPDIHWGEKPMDMSFIASAYRTEWFPPLDPWFSGNIVNYYYYGHIVFAALGLFAGVPSHYLYNLAVATLPALSFLGAFGILYHLTRKLSYGILAGYFTTLAGNLYGYLQMAHNLHPPASVEGATGPWHLMASWIQTFFSVLSLAWEVLKIPLGRSSILIEGNRARMLHEKIGFDSYFWKCGHDLIPHTVANEFPMWTYLFADLHAHMIVMPFTILLIGLAAALFSNSGRALRIVPGKWFAPAWSLFLLCIAIGTIFCVNPWDFPTSLLLLFSLLVLKWWKFRANGPQSGWLMGYGRTIARMGLPPGRLRRITLQAALFAAEVVAPLIVITAVAILLYLPFHMHFQPRIPLGPGSVLLSLGNMTVPVTWFGIFGVFFFIFASSLLYRLADRPAKTLKWLALLILVSISALGISFAVYSYSSTIIETIQSLPVLKSMVYLRPHFRNLELNYATAALLLPFWLIALLLLLRKQQSRSSAFGLLLGWIGLSVAIGSEIVFVKEGWEHPAHRYNTVFKFFLQVWGYLALAAASGLYAIRQNGSQSKSRPLYSPIRVLKSIWLTAVLVLLVASAMFPVFGTYAVTRGPGARCVQGQRPSIDGWTYLNQGRSQAEFYTLHWVNRFIEGQPTLLEDLGLPYTHESSRISTHTGVASVIGWDHHMRERTAAGNEAQHNQEIEARKRDVEQIYRKEDKASVLSLLAAREADYLYVGSRERSRYSRSVQKFLGYGDVFDLLFHTRGGDLYRIRKNLNAAFLGEAEPLPAPGERPAETGVNMFIGGSGFDNGNFREPRGIACGPDGRTYIADTFNHRIQVFDAKGNFLFLFGEEGDLDGQLREPNDLVLAPAGNLYVLDTWNHRIQVFDPEGRFLFQIALGFYGPRGIAIDSKGRLYVADTGNGRIFMLAADGQVIRQWGSKGSDPGQLFEPIGIAANLEGEIFVADSGNQRIQVFNSQGHYLRSWNLAGLVNQGRGNEQHLAIAPGPGYVYLSDPQGGQILIFQPTGERLARMAEDGDLRAPVRFPVGLAFQPGTGDLLWCEQRENRIKRVPAGQLAK